ncbi:MAG: PDZ domain-containing protein [Draconibacterium sp.]|nr:PDZ domain-containing protein [Draconibacterium sp.]
MKKTSLPRVLSLVALLLPGCSSFAVNTTDTRLMHQPAISSTHIVFVYANDLWIADSDGSNVRRLTSDAGIESNPCFSPDGKLIAFSAEYEGNTDVYTIPVEGGMPQRLTWHPSTDNVRGFTPDGKAVLFASSREDFSNRYTQLFTIALSGGFPTKLVIPNGFQASYSPNGKQMAYTPIPPRFQQWKNYRGGTVSNIWIFNFGNYETVKIPMAENRSNDWNPMWMGSTIYFLSDRKGEFNLFSYNVATKAVGQLTQYTDFPINSANATGKNIIFEQAGKLHIFDTGNGTVKTLQLAISAELTELRPRFVKGLQNIRSAHISPTGSRAVFGFRGEIITVPAEKGDPRNITESEGVHEKYPAWSPDGKSVAYFSDKTGEYQLHISPQDGKGESRAYPVTGTGFYAFPEWSPNSKFITFSDNGRNFYLLDAASGTIKKIDSDELYVPGPFRNLFGHWSADSRWIAYTKVTSTHFKQVFIYSAEQGKSFAVTDGLSDADSPIFDPDGKYLLFLASTDAGPVINWFDQSSHDMRMTNSVYVATLRSDILNPFARESDEETIKPDDKGEKAKKDDSEKENKDKSPEKKEEPVKNILIEFEGIENRIVNVPLKAGNISQLGMIKTDEFLYVANDDNTRTSRLFKYDMKERKESEVMELDNYTLSGDGKKMLYNKGQTWGITDAGKKPEAGKGMLNVAAIEIKIDPVAEWKQIFDEAWRINRDYFYDPGMHGADWPAMKEKYAAFLPHVACRNDLNRLIMWMCSEIAVGHHRVGGGDQRFNAERVEGGLLGADYEIAGNRYRFKKIYGGLNWNPGLRSPLTEPGINAKPGEYLLAVNGKQVTSEQNIYSYFEKTAGKIIEITIGSNADGSGSRVVKVEPIANEASLRNRDWVEGNLRKVHQATNGKVAYVYVPNTTTQGHEYFKRYFFPQANKEAIIIDERFNGGGLIADYYIDLLTRPYQSHWNMRYGMDLKTPSASIQGPKVMIIDETAGSGGDMLPWMFRKFNVGTLVGKATWGGLVGTLGFPELMDGGSVSAPNLAIWTKDGFIVENVGVSPDIEVEMWPADVIKGKDPQLEKAIEVALEQLKKNPPAKEERPAYPVRVRK